MWKPWISGKVKIVEVVSCNGIIQINGMMDLRLTGWKDVILILMKVMMSFLSPFWGNRCAIFFGTVNVIGLWTCYGTLLCEPNVLITLSQIRLAPIFYGKEK